MNSVKKITFFRRRGVYPLSCFPTGFRLFHPFISVLALQYSNFSAYLLANSCQDRINLAGHVLLLLFISFFCFYFLCFCKLIFSLFFLSLYKYGFHIRSISPDAFYPEDALNVLLFCPRLDFIRVTLLLLFLGFTVKSGNGHEKSSTPFHFLS